MNASHAATLNSMDLVAMMAIDQIASRRGVSPTAVVTEFLSSRTAEQLYDDNLKLWWDGPDSIVASFDCEKMDRTKR